MRKILIAQVFFLTCIFISPSAKSQVKLSGPTCVVPGSIYQYNISGNWDSSSVLQVCITGGVIYDSTRSNYCTPASGAPLATVLVRWKDTSSALLTVTSSSGNNSLNVHISGPLLPGVIESTAKTQIIERDSIPLPIICSADIGGSCSPTYLHRWQQSADRMRWINIDGATHQNLLITSGLVQPTFYRRKVTEQISGTVAYSDVTFVDVKTAPVGLHLDINSIIYQQHEIACFLKTGINSKNFLNAPIF